MITTVENAQTVNPGTAATAQAVSSTPLPEREIRRVGAASAPTRPLPPEDGPDAGFPADSPSPYPLPSRERGEEATPSPNPCGTRRGRAPGCASPAEPTDPAEGGWATSSLPPWSPDESEDVGNLRAALEFAQNTDPHDPSAGASAKAE